MSQPKRKRVHMIGNAHLDPVWLWRWEEGWQEASATFLNALQMLDEYPDFIISRGESALYEWIERSHPELIERVRERIAEGRWSVVGGWVVQSDNNLACGESLIRQALLGKRYFRDRFGVEPETAYCVDSFGHAATLPMILAGCGFRHYVMMRPMQKEMKLPSNLFRWRAPDGSEIITFRIPVAYTTVFQDVGEHLDQVLAEAPAEVDSTMCFFGVGDHGGGPTRLQIERVKELQQTRDDLEIVFSSCDAFFNEIEPKRGKCPVVGEELQQHAIGCYSAVSELKRKSRAAESSLLDGETMAALALANGESAYPDEILREGWKILLFNQFHDILPGSLIHSAYEDAIDQLGCARQSGLNAAAEAWLRIARRIDIAPQSMDKWKSSIICFNTSGVERREVIRRTPWMCWKTPAMAVIEDSEGNRSPVQFVWPEKAVGKTVDGFAMEVSVPPMGYAVYHIFEEEYDGEVPNAAHVHHLTLKNGIIEARIDPESGCLASLRRTGGPELLRRPVRHGVVPDDSDSWSHGLDRYGEIGEYFAPSSQPVVTYNGPLTAEIRTECAVKDGRLIQEFSLDAGADVLRIRCYLDWRGAHQLVAMEAPLVEGDGSTAEVPHGWVRRPADGREYPMLRWVNMGGLSVANDSKYSYCAQEKTLRITALRSPAHAHDWGHKLLADRRYDITDQGLHRYCFHLAPDIEGFDPARAWDMAEALNRPISVNSETLHRGDMAPSGSLLAVEFHGGARPVALKRAEDGDRLIVRVLDVSGKGGRVALAGSTLAELEPHQLITLSLDPDEPGKSPRIVNHIER